MGQWRTITLSLANSRAISQDMLGLLNSRAISVQTSTKFKASQKVKCPEDCSMDTPENSKSRRSKMNMYQSAESAFGETTSHLEHQSYTKIT